MTSFRNYFEKDKKAESPTTSPEALYRSAFSTFQQLGQSGVVVPKSIAEPLIAAQSVENVQSISTSEKQRLLSAIHRLDVTYKYWTDLRRKYTRNFYIVLLALLILQLFYAAASDIFKNLNDIEVALNEIGDLQKIKAEDLPKINLLKAQRRTYIFAGEYVDGIPDTVVSYLPLVGGNHPNASYNQEDGIRAETILIQLRLITSFLGAFVLPLLYGMLGAVAYILRRISNAANDDDLRGLRRKLDLRLPIGALSGLAAGWLLQPSSIPGSTISPFALAFVAGYAAELVFAAMDRIVAAFSAQPANDERQKQPEERGAPDPTASGSPVDQAGDTDSRPTSGKESEERPPTVTKPADQPPSDTGGNDASSYKPDVSIVPMSRATAND